MDVSQPRSATATTMPPIQQD